MTNDNKTDLEEEIIQWMTDEFLTAGGFNLPDSDDILNKFPVSATDAYTLRTKWLVMALCGLGFVNHGPERDEPEEGREFVKAVRDARKALASSPAPAPRSSFINKHSSPSPSPSPSPCRCGYCAVLLDPPPKKFLIIADFREPVTACHYCAAKISRGEVLEPLVPAATAQPAQSNEGGAV